MEGIPRAHLGAIEALELPPSTDRVVVCSNPSLLHAAMYFLVIYYDVEMI